MATSNADRPRGFRFAYTRHGGPPRLTRYFHDGVTRIHSGDIVDMADGRIASVTATTDLPLGVSAQYTASTDETEEIFVYDDLVNTVFLAQADSSHILGTSLTGVGHDLTATAGTTASEQSLFEVNVDSSAIGNLYIIDRVTRPNNDWGKWVDLYIQILTDQQAGGRTHPSS